MATRWLGSFSERRVWVETLAFGARGQWESEDTAARRLFFVLSGHGEVNGQPIAAQAAVEIAPGESVSFSSEGGMELFMIGLPPVLLPEQAQEQFEEVDGMVTAGETP